MSTSQQYDELIKDIADRAAAMNIARRYSIGEIKRYVKVTGNGASFIDTPAGAAEFLHYAKQYEDNLDEYKVEDVFMLEDQFNNLPEFEGF